MNIFIKKKGDCSLRIGRVISTIPLTFAVVCLLLGCGGEQNKSPLVDDVTPTKVIETPGGRVTPTSCPTRLLAPTTTAAPTNTPTLTPTETPIPTLVPTATPIPTATSTPVLTRTSTPTPTLTPTPTPSKTPTPVPTKTATPTPTFSPTPAPIETLGRGTMVWLNSPASYYDEKYGGYVYAGTASKGTDIRIINTADYPYVSCVLNKNKIIVLYWPDLSYTTIKPTPTLTPTPTYTPTPSVRVPTPTPHTPEHDYESYKTEVQMPPSLPKVPELDDTEATLNSDINYLESEDAVYEYDIYTYPDGTMKEVFQWLDRRDREHSVEIHYTNGMRMMYWNYNPAIYRLILEDGTTIDVNTMGAYPTEVWYDATGKKMYDIRYRKVDYASSISDARYVFNHLEKRIQDYTSSWYGEAYTIFVDENLNVVSGFENFKFAYDPGKVEWSNEWSIYYFNAWMADGRNVPFFTDLKIYY